MTKKTTTIIARYNSRYAKIASVMLVTLGVAILLRLTDAIDIYQINLLTSIIVANSFWIVFIAVLLFVANVLDKIRFQEQQKKEEQNGNRK
ncbi:hypothetical protein [Dubosiella newyorkensis]|uniref:hypothetical protein n=1 Tax=Dubosiella newyorkensis TaxID=1862672 RepID=UPI0025B62685|nr:hypothetical protein [Dubosiella newyorkensis]